MSTPHTPGPWTAEWNGVSQFDIKGDGVWIGCMHGDHVSPGARPRATGFPGNNEARTNAMLIIAAPEMLAALQNLENDNGAIPSVPWLMVQEAIAHATGASEAAPDEEVQP